MTESFNSQLNARESDLNDLHKQRAREQWGANPCGADAARGIEFGTPAYFDAIAHERYNVYAPWMTEVIGFDRFAGRRLLEVGFGTGTDLLQFARGGASVTGVDLTPRSIDIAQRRFNVYGLEGQFLIGDGEYLSFPDQSFDVVYSFGVLHHTPDTARAIREVHRVLRPGGEAIVMLYNRSSLAYWGGFVFKHGILKGKLLSYNVDEIMSRYAERSETGGRPLVKAYTRAEAGRLFGDFSHCEITVHQLTRRELRPFGRLVPEPVFQWLDRKFGWNLLIKATR